MKYHEKICRARVLATRLDGYVAILAKLQRGVELSLRYETDGLIPKKYNVLPIDEELQVSFRELAIESVNRIIKQITTELDEILK